MTELIVALDLPTSLEARAVLNLLTRETDARWFKVGPRLAFSSGFESLCGRIAELGHLFVDLKMYDTQDTVHATASAAFLAGASMITVHATPRMLQAAMCAKTSPDQRIIAVGPLTDANTPLRATDDVAVMAMACEADGMVCPPDLVAVVKREYPDLLMVVPGIRPRRGNESPWAGFHDNHIQPTTPAQAAHRGADFVVVGRPIISAPDPATAASAILEELSQC